MKQFYFSILFISFTFFISAQTNPTGSSTETGITAGDLAVTLSGGASYNIPIAVPPGINGVIPQISLSYNSQGGSGVAGYGWDISGISTITRIPATKFHDGEIDEVDLVNDRFALDGQRLMVKQGTGQTYGANGTQYETENFSNVKVTSYGTGGISGASINSGPIYFLVEYPDGSKAYYGSQTATGSSLEWGITYWENAQGVNIKYQYNPSGFNGWNNISSIKYGTRATTTPINEIKFVYEARSRTESAYIGGVKYDQIYRLKEIQSISNNIGFRNYSLEYALTTQNYDQLSKVTEKNGDKSKSYNPTVFQYDNTESTINYIANPTTLSVDSVSSLNAATVTGDFDGDGNMDFILYPTTGSEAKSKYWLFTGINPNVGAQTLPNYGLPVQSGSFDEIFPVSFLTSNNKYWYSQGWTILKTNPTTNASTFTTYATTGSTLIYSQNTKQYTFPKLTHTYTNCNSTAVIDEVIPKFYLNGDFNGDGLTDIVIIEKSFSYITKKPCLGNRTSQTYTGGQSYFVNLDRRVTSNFANLSGTLPITTESKCYVADFNGDGKSDIYIFDTGKVTVFSLNENNMLVQQPLTPVSNTAIKVDRPILVGDFNGDGKSDFMIPSGNNSNSWYRFPATGTRFTIESLLITNFTANDSNNSYNYFATDYDNDGKSDLTIVRNGKAGFPSKGTIQISTITETAPNTYVTKSASTTLQSNIDIYALPIYLPSTDRQQPHFEIAFINQNKLHFFYSSKDSSRDRLLKSITAGNGVQEFISYQPLDQIYENDFYSIYRPSTITETYPYFDIVSSPNFQIVTKLEKKSATVSKMKLYGYYGAVTNLEGLAFMGFRSIMESNWHDSNNLIMSSVTNRDVKLRGAVTDSYVVPYLAYPYSGFSPSSFTTKTTLSYTPSTANLALQGNKVFKLQNTGTIQYNGLDNTSVTTTNIFDSDNNITSSTSVSKEASIVAQTTTTTIDYQPAVTSPLYLLGRPTQKNQSVTTTGAPTMTSSEVYTYNSNQLLSNIDKSATGTSTISEQNDYDSYGNILKKTITAPLPLQPRNTWYEYDASGRFLTKITDNDLLISTFEYDINNGLLKKKTNPYGLSTSYTYDSWFKPLTVKDDQLNKIVTTSYTNSYNSQTGLQTTVTTTTDALDGSASEETFDDLGRKIRSGAKEISGVFSYMSFLYDIYDRNYKTSEPYFGSAPSQWNETKFDIYSRPTETKLFNLRTTTASYPPGLVSTITDGLKTKTITKNAVGNVISSNETLGGTINYSYFANGNLKQTSYNGIDINMEQNGWGQKTAIIDPSAGTFRYDVNDFGELKEETSQNGNVKTTITRDASGRPTKKTITGAGTNSETTYTYDAAKLPLTIDYKDLNEPAGTNETLTTIIYDNVFKRPTTITEEKFGVSKFTKSFDYDGLGRIITETKTAEVGGKTSTVVNKNVYKNGYLYQILDINNKMLWQTNTVSAKGQLLESITGNGIKMTNTYDTDGYLSKIQHDRIGITGNIITLTTKFDKNTDNLDSRINSAFGNYTEDFDYDELGRLKVFTNKSGIQETQNYETSGKIKDNSLGTYNYDAAKPYQNNSITLNAEAVNYYDTRGALFYENMENETGWPNYYGGSTVTFDKTTAAHSGVTSLKISNADTSEKVTHSDKWIGIDNAVDTEYTYSAWVYSDGPEAELFLFMKTPAETGYFTYVNSITTTKTGKWTKIEKTVVVPSNIKMINIRLDNNAQGNVWFDDIQIKKANNTSSLNISYNAFKSPIQIEEAGIDKISFTYNDDNQRSTMYYGGLEDKLLRPLQKHYSADGSMEVKQNMRTGAIEFVTYIGGDGYTAPIAVKSDGINPSQYLYLHRDYQGTILAITDANAAIVEKRLFDAWGDIIKVQDGAGNTLNGLTVLDRGYTGHEHLQSVGLINMNARLYDPLIHRFLQVDNYIQDPGNTQNYNQYGYVLNNPLLYTDPSGNKYGDGKDCIDCGPSETQQTALGAVINTLGSNWDDLGIKDWAKKNLNFKKWGVTDWTRKNLNFKNWGKSISSWFGGDGPPPNMSSYVNINTASNFAQGFGKMGIQTVIDGFDFVMPGFSSAFDKLGGTDYLGIRPSDNQNAGYYSAMALTFISPGGAEAGAEKFAVKGLEKGGNYIVYHGIDLVTNTVKYVGITKRDALIRFGEHLNSGTAKAFLDYRVIDGATGLSRMEARVWEQTLIKYHGLESNGGRLLNKINSIAEKYWLLYGF